MKSKIKACQLDDNAIVTVDAQLTPVCPICGIALTPRVIYSTILFDVKAQEYETAYILNHCSKCDECFISKHTFNEDTEIYEYVSSAPFNFFEQTFSDDIQGLSPDFVSIYNDSLHAESLGMTSICGMGYRKALEYLIKDFAIANNPNDIQPISNMTLAQCIEKYFDNPRLKSLAKASAWLGNDETHYVKKHPGYGTNELKAFINAIITFIDAEFAYKKARELLSSK